MADKTLVTGAGGTIGSLLVPELARMGAPVRAFVHHRSKGEALRRPGVELAVGDLEEPDGLREAMQGCDTLMLITPANPRATQQTASALTAAEDRGVRRVVRISVIKASKDGPTDNVRQHAETEAQIKASGLRYTILRPHFFMQNLFMSAKTIREEGKMVWGMGDGKMSLIDARDIADAAARVLTEQGHDGRVYELTGPASIDFYEVAKALSEALGKAVEYVPVAPESVEQALRSMGMGDWFARLMRDYSKAYAEGWGDFVTDEVERLTGRRPRSIYDFACELLAPAIKGE